MGIFDLLSPLLSGLDFLISWLPKSLRLVLWAIVSGLLTMKVYQKVSRQEEIRLLKPKVKAAQKALAIYDGEFSGLPPLMLESFRLSGRHVMLTLVPALIASLPVLFILVWLSTRFAYHTPTPGQTIILKADQQEQHLAGELYWQGEPEAITKKRGVWEVKWPEENKTITLMDPWTGALLSLPFEHNMPVIHKRLWWNALMSNPAGYLPKNSVVSNIKIELESEQYLPFGPSWMQGWEFLYFSILVATSLIIKFALRIH